MTAAEKIAQEAAINPRLAIYYDAVPRWVWRAARRLPKFDFDVSLPGFMFHLTHANAAIRVGNWMITAEGLWKYQRHPDPAKPEPWWGRWNMVRSWGLGRVYLADGSVAILPKREAGYTL